MEALKQTNKKRNRGNKKMRTRINRTRNKKIIELEKLEIKE